MTIPEAFMQPLLKDIETTVLEIHKEFPRLVDKEVETVYEKLATYYKRRLTNKEIEEPSHPIERYEALIDEILNVIEQREEEGLDDEIIDNPDFLIGGQIIPSLNHFYVTALKRLQKSTRFWRKENGPRGYLTFVSNFI